MTHEQLVRAAARWLAGSQRCRVVLTDQTTITNEQPDAIGWGANGSSILVECKASRADFLRDRRKWHRRTVGMGNRRYYLAPQGLLQATEIPEGWGFLECMPNGVKIIIAAPHRPEKHARDEIAILVRHGTEFKPWKPGQKLDDIRAWEIDC